MKLFRAAALLMWLAGLAWPAFAQTHAYSVYADLDNNPATGCTITTAAGTVPGIEAVLTADVSVDPVAVTGQRLARCEAGVLGVSAAVSGAYPYPVGFDQGAGGFDVIELGAPLQMFNAPGAPGDWLLTFGAEGALLGGADLTAPVLAQRIGYAPDYPKLIPAVSLTMLAILALALAGGTVWMARRRPQLMSILLVTSLLGLSGLVWAANYLLDGNISDWTETPLVTDPLEDATQDEPPIDIRQAFASGQGGNVYFRIDVEETRLSILLPPLLDTAFTIAENSPNGTVLGPIRPSSAALSSILTLSQTSQTPANGFAFDPGTTVLSVSDAALLDFETHDQFQLGFSATLAGLPGYSLPVTAIVDIEDVNEAPALAAQNFTVLEHAANGTPVGTVAASDPDAGANGQLTYAISTIQTAFAINAVTGVITVADAAALDVSASPYSLDIVASDAGSPPLSTSATMMITVIDVNDPPSFTTGGNVSVAEDSGAYNQPWGTALDDGDDGSQTLTFHILANDNAALFAAGPALSVVGSGGQLSFTPVANASGVANLTVVLRDNGGTANDGADESTPVDFQIAVTAVNDAPELTVPGAQENDGSSVVVFSTANGNAISVADVDAGTGTIAMRFVSDGGTLTLANPDAALTITGNGSTSVDATGTLAAFNAALNGPAGALTYEPTSGNTVARTLTASIDDQGHTGAGGALTDTATIAIDAAPTIQATPAAGLIATDTAFTLSFSEPVDVLAGAISLSCNGGPNLITGSDTGTGATTLAPVYAGPLPEGQTCVLTVFAAQVSDSDAIDPPNHPLADFTRSYSVDTAPGVTATLPAIGAVVANDVALSITFDEPIDATAGAVTLTCGGGNLITGGDTGNGVTTLTPSHAAPLPAGNCTLTVVAANIDDTDSIDPPANLASNHVVNFTVDAAPVFASAMPAEGATIATAGTVSFTFDEAVEDLGGAIVLDCGGVVAGNITGSGTPTLTFTPSAPLSEGAGCTATAVASSIGDSDDADPPEHPTADVSRNFTIDAAPAVVAILPGDGDIDVALDTHIVVTFSEPVNFTASAFTFACPGGSSVPFTVAGDGTAVATIDPTPAMLPIDTLCVFSVDAAQITDVDAIDPPDAGNGITSVGFTTVNDNPPAVLTSTPADGDIVANDVALSIGFSEAVDVAANGVTLTCGAGNLITGGASGSNVSSLSPTYTGPLPSGTCTLTVLAANVTDVDAIDPPDEMVADYVATFTVDAVPEVVAVSPANGATGVTTDQTITVEFSEPVDIASAAAFSLECPSGLPIGFTVTSPASLPASASSFTLTPSGNLPQGTTCTFRVHALAIEDTDIIDPPSSLESDFTSTFTTDTAPTVTGVTPANGDVVNITPTITVNFSESVDLDPGVFTLNCGGAVATTASPSLPASGVTSINFTPDGALPAGSSCTATVLATAVHDTDSNDPPDTMDVDHVWSFFVDAAPSVVSILPGNGAVDVNPASDILITFSEVVNFDTTANAANTSFDLECPGGTPADFTVVSASPATSVTLDPFDNAIAGATCILIVHATGIQDTDTIDPPDSLAADFSASFTFAAIANDDAINVTPHLTISTANGAVNLAANDFLGAGQITGFGFGSCSGTTPGNQLDAGPSNGRLTLAANGSFSYEPPAGVADTTRTFCYTVTGGDTANVVFTLGNTELVWFVDAAAAAGGIGTQARPFNALTAAGTAHTGNDTIFVASHASPYPAGITLLNGVRLIGQGASDTLTTHSGITPVTGSAFPLLGGAGPVFNADNAAAITLGNGNTLRGFTVGDSGTAGTDLLGSSFGTLTVGELTLNGNGRALSLTTGTLNGNFLDIDVTAGNSSGIDLDAVGGTWSVTSQVNIGNVTGTGLSVINAPTGSSATFTGGVSVTKASAGTAVNLNNNHATAVVNLGGVALTAGVAGNAGTGLAIATSPVTISGGSIATVAGPAIHASSATFTGGATLTSVSSTNSTTQGVHLSGVSGNLTIASGAISGAVGTAFNVDGGSSAITYGGTLNNTAGRSVVVQNRTGTGTVSFTGAITDTGTGVLVTANAAGNTTSFRGGLSLNTGTNAAFTATGGGTLEVCDENPCSPAASGALANTLQTTSATALQVSNTTIGSNRLEFRSISSNGGSSTGIELNNTGSNGGLTVRGTGAAGTGGTIQNKTIGISLTNTQAPSFSWMQLNGFSDYAIRGTNVVGFTLVNSVINGVNGNSAADDEGSVRFTNLTGSASISGTSISGGFEDNFRLANTSGILNRLIFSNVSIGTNSVSDGNDGVTVEAAGTAVVNVTVENSNFTAARGDLFQFNHIGTGNGDLVINNSTFSNNHPGIATGGGGVSLFTSGLAGGNVTMSVTGNTFRNSVGDAIVIVKSPGTTTQTGSFANNAVGVTGMPNSGATEGSTLRLQTVGQGTLTWSLTNNVLLGYNNFGFEMRAGGGANPEGGTINTTLTGNVIAEPGNTPGVASFPKNGLHYNIGTNVGDTFQACANLGGAGGLSNSIHLSGKDAIPATGLGDIDFRIRNRRAGINIRLPGYAGPPTASDANINSYVIPRNDLGGTPFGNAHVLVGTFSGTGTTCP
ncbi:Ig-like domain-containing protein [Xanthomonadaceae bacterium JHOS43]|nr:Ig-like domain-containing protein [Xanthomonadaceae bacterium JHOS43]